MSAATPVSTSLTATQSALALLPLPHPPAQALRSAAANPALLPTFTSPPLLPTPLTSAASTASVSSTVPQSAQAPPQLPHPPVAALRSAAAFQELWCLHPFFLAVCWGLLGVSSVQLAGRGDPGTSVNGASSAGLTKYGGSKKKTGLGMIQRQL
jgi:hypothetical protein